MATKPRNYRKEYDEYHGTPKQLADKASRQRARRALVKAGAVKPHDGKEVDHKDGNPRNNARSNLKVTTRTANRKKGG